MNSDYISQVGRSTFYVENTHTNNYGDIQGKRVSIENNKNKPIELYINATQQNNRGSFPVQKKPLSVSLNKSLMSDEKAAILIQSFYKGYKIRQAIQTSSVSPGVIHTRINADNQMLKRIGIERFDQSRGNRKIDYFSLNHKQFSGGVYGGEKLYNPVKTSGEELFKVFSKDNSSNAVVFINGSFFNMSKLASPEKPETATIGESSITAIKVCTVKVPSGYENDYSILKFNNGSYISVAPILGKNNEAQFLENKLTDAKYQYTRVTGLPGKLGHSSDPNPRAAISLPENQDNTESNDSRVRLVVGRADGRGKNSNGYTMPEWSTFMTRLDKLNNTPSRSYNLDGGGSVAIGIINSNGEKISLITQSSSGRSIANFIGFSKK
ncbi:phosphodiester glycosidase family protein [Spartinivicinus poritis]|uniref:Phosphodiester glycosidase family protein n=1 Tax=Spartinivicinus poritis TaxID=2994640 RepID=A0ABT5UDU6_9GAMM|nr:phosphodiester glycosidase family protein [Spartinivicinus sp. A2-2]MDE1464528.1 phosphodiester glycosidase family protein [Spartinivicinus sp. A2-2]